MPEETEYQKIAEAIYWKAAKVIEKRFSHLPILNAGIDSAWVKEHMPEQYQNGIFHAGMMLEIGRERGDISEFERHVLAWCKLEIKYYEEYDKWLKTAPSTQRGEGRGEGEKEKEPAITLSAPRPAAPRQPEQARLI